MASMMREATGVQVAGVCGESDMADRLAVYEQEWRELESLLRTAEHAIGSLPPDKLSRIDVLYRRATVQLARVATRGRDPQLAAYLNALTAKAHSLIYVSPRRSLLGGAGPVHHHRICPLHRAQWRSHTAAAILFFGSALCGYFISRGDLSAAYALSTPGDLRQPGSSPEQLLDILRNGRDQEHGELFMFASFLFQNNFKVAILAMATGVLASVPTVLILVANGLMLGQFTWLHSHSPELRWRCGPGSCRTAFRS